ncbi:hypothetical protein CGRA01v4_11984 [Colletotrichum graminicola]|nr:hypothetical protein CGRA01v4_11984 [Colletotrichum graminicola]
MVGHPGSEQLFVRHSRDRRFGQCDLPKAPAAFDSRLIRLMTWPHLIGRCRRLSLYSQPQPPGCGSGGNGPGASWKRRAAKGGWTDSTDSLQSLFHHITLSS